MRISIIGTGYVGLVSGACLAEIGHSVICVDKNIHIVDAINSGLSPIFESGLEALISKNIGGRLNVTQNLLEAVHNSDITLIAVGTPFDGNEINLDAIRQSASEIGAALKSKSTYHVVAVKSTVVPGTTDNVLLPLLELHSKKKSGIDFGVGMNPEFLREGVAVSDFMNPDRIIIGGIDEKSQNMLSEIYAPFTKAEKIFTNNKSAELIKYAANSLLATIISFSNEIANFSKAIGDIDAVEVMRGVHLDKRISPILEGGQRIFPELVSYLEAGCGFGGSCFPKDIKALISHGDKVGESMDLLKAVIAINKKQPHRVLQLIHKHYPTIEGVRIAVLGLAFKPGTNDMRESPSIPIVRALIEGQAKVSLYDPIAQNEAKKIFSEDLAYFGNSLESVLADAQVVIVLTRWPEFMEIVDLINRMERPPILVDGRRMFDKNSVKRYEGIGLS